MEKHKQKFYNECFLKYNKIEYRQYQENILTKCKNQNSLIVLPTGLGKTIIGILLIIDRLKKYTKFGKIIVLAPTRPLVMQHYDACIKFIDINREKIIFFTGKTPPSKRISLFHNSRIIISTPQVIKNDLLRNRYNLEQVALIIFDEAHRTKGNYAYCFIGEDYIKACRDPLIIGLTASPGKDCLNIQELCNNLYIENIVFKNYDDDDVKQYVHNIDIILENIELPIKILELGKILENLFDRFLKFFIERDLINPYKKYYSKLDFLKIAEDLSFSLKYHDLVNSGYFDKEEYLNGLHFKCPKIIDIIHKNNLDIHSVYSYCSSCISLLHSKDLLETQDIRIFKNFLEKLEYKTEQENRSSKRIVNSEHFKMISNILANTELKELVHPKIETVISIIKKEIKVFSNKKILIFTQYREIADILKNEINKELLNSLIAEKFIGQSSKINDYGYSQKEQIKILKDFRNGEINVLTATSIAEEGLDIPNVDAIIFYEPVPSEIRHIQRRGRTGRHSDGRCYILITENTVDIPFFKVAQRKENTMNSVLVNSDQLDLIEDIVREDISFINKKENVDYFELVKNLNERKEKEKEILATRSIDEIINKIDEFSESEEYKKLKTHDVPFFSDIAELNKNKLKQKMLRIKGKYSNQRKKSKKVYLNKNLKTVIKLVKFHNKNGKMEIKKLKKLAEIEEIVEEKFYIHFNQACYLGYLRKNNHYVELAKDLD